jgi:PKD repeat protein
LLPNSNGCSTISANFVVTVNANPTATITGTTSFCAGGSTLLSAATSTAGSGSITGYQWALGGSNIGGATASTYTATAAGNYTVTVTNSNGCSTTSAITVVSVNANPTATITGTASFCAGGSTVLSAATSTAGSGTITGYQWRLGGSNIGGATASTYTATAAGTYSVIVTNSNGCSTTSANFVVTVNANPVATITGTASFCSGGSTVLSAATSTAGSGTISGYQWNLGGSAIGGATASTYTATAGGNYTVTVTNSNGCSTTSAVTTVTVNTNPTATISSTTPVSCSGGTNGAATVTPSGGTPGYTYDWTPGTPTGDGTATITNLAVGSYTVTVTDTRGCTGTATATIIQDDNTPPTALCSNVTVPLNSGGTASIVPAQVDNGSSDNCGIASMSVTPNTFTCANVGANTVTLIVTDVNGNTASCTSTVTVVDNVPPAAVCQNITVNLNAAGTVSITAAQVDGGSSDACGITSMSVSPNSFTCANVGANTVTLTVTDVNGNTATCTATVTVADVTPPTAVCQNISVDLNSSGSATITAAQINNGSSDACGIASLSVSPSSFSCANTGANTVTLTVTDVNGNSSTCTATVTVNDVTPPTAICTNITAQLDGAGNVTIAAGDVDNGSTDACGIASITVSPNTFDCSDVGANTVTLTVTDLSGNVSTCTATVTVADQADPTAICQNISVNLNAAGSVSITAAQVNNGSSDNCGIASLSVSPSSFTCANEGANTVTLTVTDVNGNTATCAAIVTVNDVTPPTAVCQNISVNLGSGGTVTITGAQVNNGSSDACGIASLSVSPNTFDCSDLGANTVTLTVTDVNGNSSTCTATVTVVDVTPPVASCQNITVNLNSSGTATITAAQVNNGSSDVCGAVTLSVSPSSFTCANVGANTVTLTVTDGSGNTSTCTATVTVADVTPPTAVCQNITVQLNSSGSATITAAQVNNGSSDACGIASLSVTPSTFNCSNAGANTVTLTVTDVNGNSSTCTATVTVQDNVAPTAVCQNISVNLNAAGNATITAAQVNNGSSDACGIASLSVSPSTFTCANEGANTVTLTVTDVNGNSSTCTATVTVNDVTAPTAVCQNITLNLNSSGTATITAAQINNGSSDACGIASLSVSPSSFTCANVGANTVTLTVTDVNGNTSTCTATVTVVDNTAPTAVCQNISVNLNSSGTVSITAAQINNGSSDACGIASLSVSPSSFTCSNVGANTVTLTVTDNNGNSSTCTATVTVNDVTPPTAVCQNVTVNLNSSGTATITAAQINNGSSDACGILSFSVSPSTFNCSNVGANTVTLTVTDVNGNTATCTGIVTVNDIIQPTAVCQNITVALNGTGNASITAAQINNGSSDNCGIASLSVSPSSFDCSDLGANTVTLTVTDVNGNVATCTATVTVVDNIAPTAICQNISVNLNSSGTASITAAQVNNGSTDNCTITSLSVSPSAFNCSNVGANTVTLTVTDQSGNTSTCTATVTVNDIIPPTAVCQNITVQLDATGNVSITAAQINNGSSDNCGIASLSVSPNSFTCAGVGPNPVVLTVTDVNGNVSTCTATVTVQDNVDPVALCQNISIDLNSSGTATILASQIDNGSSDACGITSITVSPSAFTCANVGANSVTLTVTDENGNTATCNATVTVNDVTPPTTVCQNITVQLNAAGTASITAAQVNNGSSDACGIASLSVSPNTFTCANIGTNNVTLTVTDVNGNSSTCTAVVTIVDNIAPTALCQNITVQLNAGGTATINATQINNGSTDNCSIASITVSPSSFTCANVGANTVTLTVTDGSGNSSTCTATVTVQENIAPTALCQNITVNLNPAGTASITAAQINNGSFDNCGISSITASPTSFTCANVGANTVTLTVTDVNGNISTCTATVTVVDNIAPTAVCQNITVQLDASGNTSILANDVDGGSTDNCGIASLSVSPSTFNCSDVGANTVTLTVTDVNGNVSTCLATVTVQDNVAPNAVCQNITVNLNAAGTASITAAQINNGSSDNCGIASVTVSPSTFNCSNVGANTVTLTVTDVNGNVSTCTATVTVVDNIAPTAVCQNITVQLNPAGAGSITAAQINNGSSDNCGIASLSVTPNTFDCSDVGANTVTLTVTDVNGNTSTCTATVTVENNVAPSVVCQDISVDLNSSGTVSITAAQVNNGSSASCGLASLTVTPSTFNCSNVGANTVTLTAVDVNGNSSSCTATVTVNDVTPPVAICQNITVNLNAAGTAAITAAQINNGSNDACGIASLSVTPNTFNCTNVGANTVTLTVTDVNGNSSTCTATVTVVDNVAPVAQCQNISVQLNAGGNASITAAQINNASSDACGIASLSVSPSTFTCANVGANTVILTVTDVNGNSSTCTATVTVADNIAPTALCQSITVNLNAAGTASITAAQINNGSSDACGIASLTVSPSTFTCANIGANIVTLTVTDNNGNVSTCTATVTVVDNIAPVAVCQNITIALNAAGTATITAAQVNNGSSDACGISSLSVSPSSFTCANVGANTVTLTVTDVNGNVSTCTATVTIVDNTAPVALCQNVSINLNSSGNGSVTAAQVNNGSNDACGILSVSVSPSTFTCANVGNNNVTLTVTDIHGNVSTCSAIVTVNDVTPPTAICQNISVNLNSSGTATITAAQINNGSSDACGIASLTVTPNSFTCTNVGPNTVVLTVTDVNGNSSTCNATVTVNDVTAPTAICQNITVQLDATGNATITANDVNNGSSDACGIASLSVSPSAFNCSNVGANTVTLTVTDVNGNISTCTATATVENNVAPTVICQNITVSLDANGNAVITASQVNNGSNAACGISSLTVTPNTFTCANIGLNTVTLTAVDVNGNVSTCTAQVTITDNVAPNAVCQNITTQLNSSGTVTVTAGQIDNGSTDSCGIASMTTTPSSFTCANLGANTVTLTVTDNYGNSSTCSSTVTVVDNIAPTALCQNISVNLNAAGTATITAAQINNNSTDNCSIVSLSVSPNSFTCANVGANTVTLTVTDQSGNSSTCTATVTVNDVTPPVANCQNITVNLDASGNASVTAAQINNNSTDACGIASMTVSQNSFTCAGVGANPVTLTVTDVNGNISTCTAIVTVVDNVPPVATCQNITVQLNSSGTVSITASQVNNGSSDACGIASLSVSPSSFTCANIGANTVTLTVTDVNGNTATCQALVTVQDITPPTAVCQNISVALDATGNASITALQINNGSSDNCGIASISVSPNTFTCANVGANTVTLTVTDVNGNTSTCSSTVTVLDLIAPTAICQNITVQLDASGNAAITAAQINNGSSDACGIASLSVNPNTFSCSDVGANTVVLTVTDVNGNSSTCNAIVTIEDNINPVANCQNITVALDANGDVVVTAAQIDNGSTDNCGIASIMFDGAQSQLAFDCSDVGINTVTLTVTDVNGNSSTCSATVTVEDNIAPNAICQNITAQLDANGDVVVTAAQIDNGSNDACGIASIVIDGQSQLAYDCSDVGVNTVTLTVTDVNGNVSTCLATITVEDNIAPAAICQNITIALDANGNVIVTAAQINNGSSDNCGIASIEINGQPQVSFNCGNVGANTVTLTVTDVNGNVSTCTATVTVEDNVAPNAICQNITVQLDATGNVVVTAAQIDNGSNDNCGITSILINGQSQISFGCTDVGVNTVTLTVTDVNGNVSTCTATVTVLDNASTPPTAICQDITVQLDASGNTSILPVDIDNGSFDNCGIASMTVSPSTFNCSNVGANPVTLTVTDLNGNVSTCTATVTVEDNVVPNAICQNITAQLDANGNLIVTAAQINNGSNDACGILTVTLDGNQSQLGFDCSNVGVNTVTLIVTDIHGNISTCNATVTVEDTIAPNAICQNITAQLDATGNIVVTATQINNGSNDNCGIASITLDGNQSQLAYDCSNVGVNNVILTVTDVNGNVSTCSATITIEDNINPTAICQNITAQLDATGSIIVTATQINNGSNDNCGIASITLDGGQSQLAFDCSNVGVNTVTLTVTDVNGNVSTCSATITIEDNIDPAAICQNITVQLDANGNAVVTAAQIDNGSNDNCGIASVVINGQSQLAFDCSNVGVNNVTLTVTDVNGNVSTCSATITVQDNAGTPPTAICQDITVQLDATGNTTITAADVDGGSFDNCGIASLSVSQTSFDCGDVGANTVTLTVTDVNGNSSQCTATVTVEDTIAPAAVCQNITAQLDATGNVTIAAGDVDNGSSDACGIASITVSPNTFTCANIGANTVTLTVTDVNGNVSTCTATATVEDNVNPVAQCQNITVQLDATGNATITAAQLDNGSTDACGIASMTLSTSSFSCADIGSNNVTLTITDVNGNSATCAAVVTVEDNIAPVAVCQDISVQLNPGGSVTITAAQVNNGSSDACGIAALSVSPSTFTCANVGPNTVTLTVIDNNGNQSTCTATVTVLDNNAPTALCQNITVQLDANGNASIIAAQVDNGSGDQCGPVTLNINPSTFDCSNIGANTVTLTVTDQSGNSTTCTATVTIEDNVAPVAICHNINVELDANGQVVITAAQVDNGTTDNCSTTSSGLTFSLSETSFDCSNIGSNIVTFTATDAYGNSSTCTATVNISDTVSPVVVCQNITVDLDANGNATITAAQVDNGSADACGIASMVVSPNTFDCSNIGANTVTFTVTDNNGNSSSCTAIVTIEDNTAPTIVCQNITVQLDANGNAVITAVDIDGGSTDNCSTSGSGLTFSASQTAFDCSNIGANTITLTVTDAYGNSSTCDATVTVADTVSPVAICQSITVQLDANGQVVISAIDIDGGSTDNCSDINSGLTFSASQTTFDCSDEGSNTVTLTVTDAYGNVSTCTATVTVENNITPAVVCQDITVQLDATGNVVITAADVDGGTAAACGIASLTVSPSSFDCSNVGANTVTLTATDNSGNTSTCTAIVTVQDTINPTIVCQNITVALDANGNAVITGIDLDNGTTDNCSTSGSGLTYTASQTNFDCSNIGTNTVTLTVTDANGNSSTCDAVVTITDTVSPTVICQSITVQLDANGNAVITAIDVDGGSSDNCSTPGNGLTYAISDTDFDCSNVGVNTVTLTVTDANGNSSSCSATVTIVDDVDPIALCRDITIQLDNNGQATIDASQVNNGSSDNCGIATMTVNPNTFTCSGIGANPVTLTVTDVNGNVSSCTATVTIQDNVDPVALCQNITIDLDGTGNTSIVPSQVDNGSSDACGIATITVSPNTFDCSNVGANTVTLVVTDLNGNIDSCTSVVTVVDATAPNAICQNITVALDSNGVVSITAAQIDNGSTDACGIDTMTLSVSSFDCSNVGENLVTLTVTDVNGNSDNCFATVTVTDVVAPEFTFCPADITIQPDSSNCNPSVTWTIPVAADNCGVTSFTSNFQSGNNFPVGTTTVTYTAVDASGNTTTCSFDINVLANPLLIAAVADTFNCGYNVACNGNADGSATAMPAGGCMPYSYAWSNGQTSQTATGLSATTYSVTVTDGLGNTATTTISLTEPAQLAVDSLTSPVNSGGWNINCANTNNGIINLAVSGGSDCVDYNYAWTGPNGFTSTDENLIFVYAGTYYVTITDINGCSINDSITLTEPELLEVNLVDQQDVSCNGLSDGSATVEAVGGANGYQYLWSNGVTTATADSLEAGIYFVSVTDNNGCIATTNVIIGEPNPLIAYATVASDYNGSDVSCAGDQDGLATVLVNGGTPNYTFLWSNGSTDDFASDLGAGTHFVTATDANGCDTTVSVTLIDPAVLTADVISVIEPSCNGAANGSATVQAAGGTPGYFYYWSNTQTGATASNLASGTYTVTVSDTNGCNVIITVTVGEPQALEITSSNINVTDVSCSGGNDGAIDITPTGGTAPYTYAWDNGATTEDISALTAGTYIITLADSLGCDTTISIIVNEPAPLVATISSTTSPSCNGNANGTATVDVTGGTVSYNYLWSDGQTTATAINLAAGTHSVIVTDANGCSDTTQAIIADPVTLTVSAEITSDFNGEDVSCFGANNGIATATPAGGTAPYTYIWSNGQTGAVASNLFAGTYIVTATDANGCSATDTVLVVDPAQLTAVISNTSTVSCAGQANGSATVNVTGGVAPYIYSWTNGQTTQTATGLAFGIHQVTVVDANGCSQTVFADITEPPSLTASVIFILDVTCNGGSNGAGFIDVVGGTAPYTYLWSDGTTTEDLNGVGAGDYTVQITDASGCDTSLLLVITQPTAMVANIINQVNVGCAGGATGEATIDVSGGIPGYTYLWDNGATTVTATDLPAGLHSVTIRDANNCITIVNFVITENAVLSAGDVDVNNVTCNGANNGSISFDVAGGNTPYTYAWSNGQSTVPAINLEAGDYSVTVTDSAGCALNLSFTVSEPADLVPAITNVVQPACGGSATGIATVGVTGGTPSYTFAWDNGQTTATATNLTSGVHTVVVTDAAGCSDSTTVTIIAPGNMSISLAGSSQPTCFGGANGTATVLVTGGTTPYTYDWTPSANTGSTATGLSAGIYVVVASDANGCAASQTITITQPSQIVADINSIGNVVCAGDSVTISATATGGNGVYTYTWNNGLGNGASHIVLPSVPTTYVVTVTDGLGCAGTQDSVTVTISAPPVAAFTVPTSNTYSCTYPVTVDFTNTSTNAVSYAWDFGNGTNATTTNGQAAFDTTGTYTVILTATSASGCVDTAVYVYNVYPAPTASFSLSGNAGCAPYTVSFTNNSVNGVTYYWNFGDGDTSMLSNPSHTYEIPGTYNVTLVVSGGGICNDTLELTSAVTVYQTPVADFTSDYFNITDPDGQIQFTNLSTGATTYDWDFGDGNTSTLENPINNYLENGDFDVMLIATSGAGCSDTIIQTVEVELMKGLYMPNAMIVGGDGDFGFFLPKGAGIATYQCMIFDKWGNLLWETSKLVDGKPVEGWDGRYNGVVVPQGAYIWKADATFMDGTQWEGMEYENGRFSNTGNVTVLE